MLALANSVCLLALSPGMQESSNSAKHGTALHTTSPHAGHDTAQHRTALRRAVELGKLKRAGSCVLVLSASSIVYARGSDPKTKFALARTESG